MQAKWRAVEEHLLSEAPPAAPFRTALLRLRLSDETQVRVGRGLRLAAGNACGSQAQQAQREWQQLIDEKGWAAGR